MTLHPHGRSGGRPSSHPGACCPRFPSRAVVCWAGLLPVASVQAGCLLVCPSREHGLGALNASICLFPRRVRPVPCLLPRCAAALCPRCADVHSCRIDPFDPRHWLAVTGRGLYATRDAGGCSRSTWCLPLEGTLRVGGWMIGITGIKTGSGVHTAPLKANRWHWQLGRHP